MQSEKSRQYPPLAGDRVELGHSFSTDSQSLRDFSFIVHDAYLSIPTGFFFYRASP